MIKDRAYGTDDNRIILTPKNSTRLHSSRCLKLNGSGKNIAGNEYVDFYKVTSNKVAHWDTAHISTLNFISNPHLSSTAIRVGIWLFIYALDVNDEILIDLTGSRVKNWKSIGDEGLLCFSSSYKTRAKYAETAEALPLLTKLKKDQICTTKEQLYDALFELHHFQYITVTDVSYKNSRVGRQEEQNEQGNSLIDPESKFAFIQLNMRLTTHNFSGKWSPMAK